MYLYTFEAFSVPCELHIEAPTQSGANKTAQSIITNTKQLENRYSFFRENSEIHILNHRSDNTHIISEELSDIIRLALFYTHITQGAFDIALAGTLKAASKALSLTEYQQIKDSLSPFASSTHLSLEGNCLTFSNDLTKIDLGGIVKEYAVDQAILQLQSVDIQSALINYGGDIAAYGRCHDLPWRVGIENPASPESNLLEVELNNNSVCTSGHSKRFVSIENEKITHIISSSTTPHFYNQVSVMAPTTLDAGIWSTALLINPHLIIPPHIHVLNTI